MNVNGAQILICDDEPALRRMVADYLTHRGFSCEEAESAAVLRDKISDRTPDLVLLDIRMPGEDGLTALRSLRSESDDPAIIMLTAVSDTVDRVVGLELGADDYLAKPVDLRELEARIKAVIRRRQPAPAEQETAPACKRVAFGECLLDLEAAHLTGPDGSPIEITAMEFALLKVFATHKGRVLSRDQLLELAHDRGWEPFDRSIDLRISRLRRKIEPDPGDPTVIKTVRGIGYVLAND
ncbi:response regulator [Roseibium sp. HPY-6]|uniref:response regulator n=1 Tax=Roseibium sp. HPY-6 TaxID=3229852 RepID=UPI003390207D